MKPFGIYHSFKEHAENSEQKLGQLVLEIVQPDAIYLLGATLNRRRIESIFAPSSPSAMHISGYFLLVIINDPGNKPLYEWQDQIEQHLRSFATVTVIVLETITFQQWLNTCHPFAETVAGTSVPFFKKENVQFVKTANTGTHQSTIQQSFTEGQNKARSFLAGAELYELRKEYKLAAFMLHQSIEQALCTLIKCRTGYQTHTHSIERLLRYSSMVSYQIPDIFPRNTDKEKQLFKLLQSAYSEARYGKLYTIGHKEINLLMEKAKEIIAIVDRCAIPENH